MAGPVDAIDSTLEQLLLRRVTRLGPGAVSSQIGFQPPASNWSSAGSPLALNVYLVDLREDRRLRSTDRSPRSVNGSVVYELAPMRLDRHYLISAWSQDTDLSERARTEHELLSEVVAVLANTPVLIPRSVYPPGALPSGFPAQLADEPLPVTVVPHEGFPKLAEFWGTIPGPAHAWKPVVYLIVTVPVFLDAVFAGKEVTTVGTGYRPNGGTGGGEILVQIGGVLRDRNANPVEVGGAWVELSDATGARVGTTRTNTQGEFTFADLSTGSYHLEARAPGHRRAAEVDVTVPSASGRYDLEFP
jgi:Pvc16 N-terminal domain/Carboxypeptidase regulatory-like domain